MVERPNESGSPMYIYTQVYTKEELGEPVVSVLLEPKSALLLTGDSFTSKLCLYLHATSMHVAHTHARRTRARHARTHAHTHTSRLHATHN